MRLLKFIFKPTRKIQLWLRIRLQRCLGS